MTEVFIIVVFINGAAFPGKKEFDAKWECEQARAEWIARDGCAWYELYSRCEPRPKAGTH